MLLVESYKLINDVVFVWSVTNTRRNNNNNRTFKNNNNKTDY